MSFSFTNQMEENVGFQLVYPCHINADKLTNTTIPPLAVLNKIETNSFERVLHYIYREPFAVYLTDEDKQYYSEQQLTLIEKVIAREQCQSKRNMALIELDLTPEAIAYILDYKNIYNLTFEDALQAIIASACEEALNI